MSSEGGLSREENYALLGHSSDSQDDFEEKRVDDGRHFAKKSEQKYASRCGRLGCRSKTRYLCGRCNVLPCPECFQLFHSA
ncbi:hypothetical protein MRX96_002907 [Rhipicephalus microplus]